MTRLLSIAFVLGALLASAAPASADWIADIIDGQKRAGASNSESPRARSRASRNEDADEQGERRARSRRVANDDNDDGSRPQRRAETKPTPRRSLSDGDSGGTVGVASYYHEPQALASGGRFNPNALTAAHKTLPFGTRVRVTHLGNGQSVDVTINDRGPYVGGRIIDLSRRAAQDINMTGSGVARVRMTVLGRN